MFGGNDAFYIKTNDISAAPQHEYITELPGSSRSELRMGDAASRTAFYVTATGNHNEFL
jgi:hypothetical protein